MFIVDSGWALDGCCYFLVGSGWLLLFPGGLWMVAVISWWALDGCCYFLVGSGWLLLFLGGLWMVAVISWISIFRFPFPFHSLRLISMLGIHTACSTQETLPAARV